MYQAACRPCNHAACDVYTMNENKSFKQLHLVTQIWHNCCRWIKGKFSEKRWLWGNVIVGIVRGNRIETILSRGSNQERVQTAMVSVVCYKTVDGCIDCEVCTGMTALKPGKHQVWQGQWRRNTSSWKLPREKVQPSVSLSLRLYVIKPLCVILSNDWQQTELWFPFWF